MQLLVAISDPDACMDPCSIFNLEYLQTELSCAIIVAMSRCPLELSPEAVTKATLRCSFCNMLVPVIIENDPTAFKGVLAVLFESISKEEKSTPKGDASYAVDALLAIAMKNKR